MSGSITSITTGAIKEARKGFDTLFINIARADDPNASESINEISTRVSSSGDILGLRSHVRRNEDPALAREIRAQSSNAAKISVIENAFISLESVIGNSSEPLKSKLINSIDDFIAAAIALSSNNDISL